MIAASLGAGAGVPVPTSSSPSPNTTHAVAVTHVTSPPRPITFTDGVGAGVVQTGGSLPRSLDADTSYPAITHEYASGHAIPSRFAGANGSVDSSHAGRAAAGSVDTNRWLEA